MSEWEKDFTDEGLIALAVARYRRHDLFIEVKRHDDDLWAARVRVGVVGHLVAASGPTEGAARGALAVRLRPAPNLPTQPVGATIAGWHRDGDDAPDPKESAPRILVRGTPHSRAAAHDAFGDLRAELDGATRTLATQSAILTGVANALRGNPPELVTWSHHDLVVRAAQVAAERDDLAARVRDIHADSIRPREEALREAAAVLGFAYLGAQGYVGAVRRAVARITKLDPCARCGTRSPDLIRVGSDDPMPVCRACNAAVSLEIERDALVAAARQSVCVLVAPPRGGYFAAVQSRKHGGAVELPGGKVEPGEAPAVAASRETREEIGVEIHPSALETLGTFLHVFEGHLWCAHAFAARFRRVEPGLAPGDDGPAVWAAREQLLAGTYGPVVARILAAFDALPPLGNPLGARP